MPKPSPFHERTRPLCTSYRWKTWAGYHAVASYDICHEREYNAFRQGAGLIDVSPLHKYDVTGPDAAAFLSRVTVRDLRRLPVGRVLYLCWTDDNGHILDDGTCMRLDNTAYRLTAAEPSYHWLIRHSFGFDVCVRDRSEDLAALALQGPTSREILRAVCDVDVDALKFFGAVAGQFDGFGGHVTRTGYTGDLGYEIWVEPEHALRLWDVLMDAGHPFNIHPAGLDALDVCRIEAGFVMAGVDYLGAHEAIIPSQKSTPFELGLGWTVKLGDRPPCIGYEALIREKAAGSQWSLVGLDIGWEATEALYDEYGLPPALSASAWRAPVPIYATNKRQVGRATSGVWSPILKKNLALATVETEYAADGTGLEIEMTVEWARRTVPAKVVPLPFYDPPRKKSVIDTNDSQQSLQRVEGGNIPMSGFNTPTAESTPVEESATLEERGDHEV